VITFVCPCGRQLRAHDGLAGKKVRCPACNQTFTVPEAAGAASPRAAYAVQGEEPTEPAESPAKAPRRRRPRIRVADDDAAPPAGTSGKATASLVLGICSLFFCLLTAVPAIVLGALALKDIGTSRGRLGGRGMAISGLVLGVLFLTLWAGGVALLVPAVHKVRRAAETVQSQNNLKRITLAMHMHHDTAARFPPAASCGPDGKPLLSWRVALLPYMEEQALYKQFRLDEPWDSPHNKPLLGRMPAVYAHPAEPAASAEGLTVYQVLVGPHAAFEPVPGPGKGPPRGLSVAAFSDGTSTTWLAAEADQPVPWTKPEDLAYDPKGPLPRLGTRSGGYTAAFADGAVRQLRLDTPEATLRAYITRDGGEPVDPDDPRRERRPWSRNPW
jgi:hypothetical protein